MAARKKARKKTAKKTTPPSSVKTQLAHVIKNLQTIKKHV
jgi:hypothetical protein